MLTPGDVALVRAVMGVRGESFDDATLMAETSLELSWSEIVSAYPDVASVTDPGQLDTITRAHAFVHAAMMLSTLPAIASSRLGDESVSFETGDIARAVSRWRRTGMDMIAKVVAPTPFGFGMFTVARGKRGE